MGAVETTLPFSALAGNTERVGRRVLRVLHTGLFHYLNSLLEFPDENSFSSWLSVA